MTRLVVAIDGGGTKTEAVAVTLNGEVAGRRRASTSSPHAVGLPAAVELIAALVEELSAGAELAGVGAFLSGLDLPGEVTGCTAALRAVGWSGALLVDNDIFAVLRAGTREPDAVAVVCGTGMNAVGRRRDGAIVRFPALGTVSGDWGGGHGLGSEALWHAARHEDGRGPATALTAALRGTFAVSSVARLIEQLHLGERDHADLAGLAPAVFAAADAGDAVAMRLVHRQAEEIVTWAVTCLRRLELLEVDVPVVLGGGVLQARQPLLMGRVEQLFAQQAPRARPLVLDAPPVLGAALLTLEAVGAGQPALDGVTGQLGTR